MALFGEKTVNIGFIYDGPGLQNYPYFRVLKEEIADILSDDFQVTFTDFEGNWTSESIQIAVDKALDDPNLDAIVPVGLLSSQEVMFAGDFEKPIAIPYVMSQEVQKMLEIDRSKLPKNLIIILGKKTLKDDLHTLHQVRPFKKIAIVGDDSILGDDFKFLRNGFANAFAGQDVDIHFIPVKSDVGKVIADLEKHPVDAVFFYPTWRVSSEDFQKLVLALSDMGIASFSYLGEPEVEQGVLLTTTPKGHLKRVSRRIALNLLEILSDDLYGEIELDYAEDWDLIVNRSTAEKLEMNIPIDLMGTVRFVGEGVLSHRQAMNISEIAKAALLNNQDISTEEFKVRVSRHAMGRAKADLLPQIDGQALWLGIDADRARIAGGVFPQYQLHTSLVLTQPIINDDVATNYAVHKKAYLSQRYSKNAFELDVVLEASLAYINYLKSKAAVDIAYDNLMLTKANLRRAKERVNAGEASNAEVYRWESEMSSNHDRLIIAQSQLDVVKIQFNRVLNRPLESEVEVANLSKDTATGLLYFSGYDHYFDQPEDFKSFKKGLRQLAVENAPELKAIDEQINAHYKIYSTVKRAHILPKVNLRGEVGRGYRGGAGKRPITGVPVKDTELFLGVQATLPLYTSGGLTHEQRKACYALKQLQSERCSLEQKIEELVIRHADLLKTQYHSIFLADRSVESAAKNLEIVTNQYSQGLINIVDLIDAQNSTLNSRIAKWNAEYDFLAEIIRLQRASGQFYFLNQHQEHF